MCAHRAKLTDVQRAKLFDLHIFKHNLPFVHEIVRVVRDADLIEDFGEQEQQFFGKLARVVGYRLCDDDLISDTVVAEITVKVQCDTGEYVLYNFFKSQLERIERG